jgi:hypothetical protein
MIEVYKDVLYDLYYRVEHPDWKKGKQPAIEPRKECVDAAHTRIRHPFPVCLCNCHFHISIPAHACAIYPHAPATMALCNS